MPGAPPSAGTTRPESSASAGSPLASAAALAFNAALASKLSPVSSGSGMLSAPAETASMAKGATVERARAFAKDCNDLGLVIHGDFILGLPGETKESIRNTINFAKTLDCETIQVSIAHAYPGTEFYDYAKANGFITNEKMEDGGGHQMAHIEYPGLPTDYVMEMVHRFYDEYYFRPKAAFRVVWKAIVNRDVPRLYVEAKAFMKLRAERNKAVKQKRSQPAKPAAPVNAGA